MTAVRQNGMGVAFIAGVAVGIVALSTIDSMGFMQYGSRTKNGQLIGAACMLVLFACGGVYAWIKPSFHPKVTDVPLRSLLGAATVVFGFIAGDKVVLLAECLLGFRDNL